MSVVVAGRLAARLPEAADHVLVTQLAKPIAYVKALQLWQVREPTVWRAITSWSGHNWDDLVNKALYDQAHRAELISVFEVIARACDEVAVWYAGFPDELPLVFTPSEFVGTIEEQLRAGVDEPSVRMVRVAEHTQ